MSANEQRRAHFYQIAKAKKLVGDQVKELATSLSVATPCEVEVRWFAPDRRRRDSDGLGPFLKAVCDGLVQAGAIEDDHSDYVCKTSMSIVKTDMKNPRIEVLITEMG